MLHLHTLIKLLGLVQQYTSVGPKLASVHSSCSRLLLSLRVNCIKKCSTEEEAGNVKDEGSNTSLVWTDEVTHAVTASVMLKGYIASH